MFDFISIFDSITNTIGKYHIDSNVKTVTDLMLKFRELSNEELKQQCRQFTTGEYENYYEIESKSFIEKLIKIINLIIFKNKINALDANLIALGSESFRRSPADLEEGSFLYVEQLRAAVSLTQNCLIQMDTGEGKTYAILPSAFTLACKYNRVYIICANDYLAERDAKRTKKYWDFVGLTVGLAILNATDEQNWERRIIYTTLSSLIFKYLKDEIGVFKPKFPITFSAIIIDEADAILLDQAWQDHSLINHVNSNIFDWSFAIENAKRLNRDEHITVNYYNNQASLTLDGQSFLYNIFKKNSIDISKYHLYRYATEVAYIALFLVEEGKDYVVKNHKIHPFDKIKGEIQYDQTRNWLIPLEIMNGYQSRPEIITLHRIPANVFIKKFDHISGLSGTLKEDSLEYLFSYWLPIIIIPPRKRKYNGLQSDKIYKTKNEVFRNLSKHIKETALRGNRPILVGAQNINEIHKLYNILISIPELKENTKIYCIIGKEDENLANIFLHGGEIGSIIIATQLSGRGVDIRLTKEAKRNGGLALFGIERSDQIRHDIQFLGRAGRQGDPFSAVFYLSLEDDLLIKFGGERIKKIMDSLGMEEDEIIEHSLISKAIASAQRKIKLHNFYKRRSSDYIEASLISIYNSIKIWFTYLQTSDDDKNDEHISNSFLYWIIDDFLSRNLFSLIKKELKHNDAKNIVIRLKESLCYEFNKELLYEIDGKHKEYVINFLRKYLADILKEINDRTNKRIEKVSTIIDSYIDKDCHGFSKLIHQSIQIKNRRFRKIAYWTIQNIWSDFLSEKERIEHIINNSARNILDYNRLVSEKISEEWDKRENEISKAILINLFLSEDIERLDGLFIYEDNKELYHIFSKTKIEWDLFLENKNEHKNHKFNSDEILVKEFINLHVDDLDEAFSKGSLKQTLMNFIMQSPISSLQSTDKIQIAFERWYDKEVLEGVSKKRRQLNHAWLKIFLIFLYERNYIASLPGLKHEFKSIFIKVYKNIQDVKTLFPLFEIMILSVFIILFVNFGKWIKPKSLTGEYYYIDLLLCGGLLSKGVIISPALLAITSANLVTLDKRNTLLTYLFAICIGIWFIWDGATFLSILKLILLLALILYSTNYFVRSVEYIENVIGISLVSVWICYCILFGLIPQMLLLSKESITTILISLIFIIWHQFINTKEFILFSTHVDKSSLQMKNENIRTNICVKGSTGFRPHFYALIFSFLVHSSVSIFFSNNNILFLLSIVIYFLTLILMNYHIIELRFSFDGWRKRLFEKRQLLINGDNFDDLQVLDLLRELKTTKITFLKRELIFQIILFLFAIIILHNSKLYNISATFPVFLFILSISFLLGENIFIFYYDIKNAFINRVPNGFDHFDLSIINEPKEEKKWTDKIKDFFDPTKRITSILRIIIFVIIIINYLIKLIDYLIKLINNIY